MNSGYLTRFSKATLTGVFTGFGITVLCLMYNVFYRESTHFLPADLINVSSLIFAVNLLFLIIGIIFYGFLHIKKGELIFMGIFLLLTVYFVVKVSNSHRFDVPLLNSEYHELMIPIVIMLGLAAAVGIPYLYHSKKFEEGVL
jgi:hypothetical protein